MDFLKFVLIGLVIPFFIFAEEGVNSSKGNRCLSLMETPYANPSTVFSNSSVLDVSTTVEQATRKVLWLYALEIVNDYSQIKHESYGGVLTERAKATKWDDYQNRSVTQKLDYINNIIEKLDLMRWDRVARESKPKYPWVFDRLQKIIFEWDGTEQAEEVIHRLRDAVDSDPTPTVNLSLGEQPLWFYLGDHVVDVYTSFDLSKPRAFELFESGIELTREHESELRDFSWVISGE